MARFIGIAILGLMLFGSLEEPVSGQEATLAESYGRGVQAYFNGEYDASVELLTAAISLNSPDPRCHFFRGLAHAKLGNQEKAAADFKNGSDLEALDVGENYPVSKALVRVQGQVRVAIEARRRQSKTDLKELQEERRRVRLEESVINEEAAVRKTPQQGAEIVGANEKILASLPALPADATRNITNPFSVPVENLNTSDLLAGKNSRPSTSNPTIKQPIASGGSDPFAKPTTPEPTPTADSTAAAGNNPADPFAPKPAAGDDAADPFAAKPAAGDDAADPFAAKPAAGDDAADPFAPKPAAGDDAADPLAPKPAAGNEPAGEDAVSGVVGATARAIGRFIGGAGTAAKPADPFGDDTPAKPADPFGGDVPAKPADPFGGDAKPEGAAKPAPAGLKVTGKQIIDFLDKDKDGKISKDEAPEDIKKNFQFIDKNGDGVIDLEEAQAMADFTNNGNTPDKPARPAAKPADPFGGNDPFKP